MVCVLINLAESEVRLLWRDADEDAPRGRPFVDVELREHFLAASSSQDTYTLLKFYNLSKDLVKTVLRVNAPTL